MKLGKITAMGVAALVLGFALGNFGSAIAATDTSTGSATSTVASCGLRIGQSMRDAGGRLSDVVASLTGMSVDDVQAKRAEGESFADIAKAKGVDSGNVVAKALDIRKDVLDAKVKSGAITQDQADAALDRMTSRLKDRVDSTTPGCDGQGGGRGGNGGGCGMGGGQGGRGQGGGQGAGCGGCSQTVTQ